MNIVPFLQTPRIHFEFGAIKYLPAELEALGIKRPLFITDQGLVKAGIFECVCATLPSRSSHAVFGGVPENPTAAGVEQAYACFQAENCDGIVAVGGGSVIDTAKAVAVLGTHPGPITNYMGMPERITNAVTPLIAIPTTAGTGSEASRGAGIHPDSRSRAKGLNSPWLVPRVAICDPELTISLPTQLTAGTGMDALSHCVEGFLSKTVNPILDAVALDGVERVFAHVERATRDGNDREARWHMMMAGLQGGMSINKGLGPGHAMANTFGDRGLHHGALVTLSLPAVLRTLSKHIPEKMERLSQAMGSKPGQSAGDTLQALNARVGLPDNLKALRYVDFDLDDMAADAHRSFFNRTSPYHPTFDEYKTMIREVLG